MSRPDIPGFYYDPVKNKYYRIQPNHIAPDVAHNRQNVQIQARVAELEAAKTSRESKQKLGEVDRPHLQYLSRLRTRLGVSPFHNRDIVTDFYASNLSCQELHAKPERGFTNFVVSLDRKLYFEYRLYAAGAGATFDTFPVVLASAESHSNISAYYPVGLHRDVHPVPSYHLCLVDGLTTLTAGFCWWWGQRPICAKDRSLGSLLENGRAGEPSLRYTLPSHYSAATWGGLGVPNRDNTIWDMSSAPVSEHSSQPPRFALASSAGLTVVQDSTESIFSRPIRHTEEVTEEQMTVAFKDYNLVMSGQRNGVVRFEDCRTPKSNIVRLRHFGGAVTGICPTQNDAIIIVSGFSGTSTYDLRYVAEPRLKRKGRHRKKIRYYSCATPLQRFRVPKERESDHYKSGKQLAYSSELDLCAVASGRTDLGLAHCNHVTLYRASTGQMLRSRVNDYDHNAGGDLRSIGIARIRDGPESVIVLQERVIQEWNVIEDKKNINGLRR